MNVVNVMGRHFTVIVRGMQKYYSTWHYCCEYRENLEKLGGECL